MNEPTDHDLPHTHAAAPSTDRWERETLEKPVFATVQERKSARRWSIFFRFAFLFLALLGFWALYDFNLGGAEESLGRHTALIEIEDNIDAEGSGSADNVIPALNKAFADAGSAAVILRINSPGGSPVQAGIIVDEMQRLRQG